MKKKLEYEAKRGIANFIQKPIRRASFLTGMSQNTVPPNKYSYTYFNVFITSPYWLQIIITLGIPLMMWSLWIMWMVLWWVDFHRANKKKLTVWLLSISYYWFFRSKIFETSFFFLIYILFKLIWFPTFKACLKYFWSKKSVMWNAQESNS